MKTTEPGKLRRSWSAGVFSGAGRLCGGWGWMAGMAATGILLAGLIGRERFGAVPVLASATDFEIFRTQPAGLAGGNASGGQAKPVVGADQPGAASAVGGQAAPTPPAGPSAPVPLRFVVVLDAAHGGDDGGAQLGATTQEKTVTLDLSVRLRSVLAARGFQVVTTRETNTTLEPDQRAQIANHAAAAACLSLHASTAGSGVHVFVSSLEPVDQRGILPWKTAQAVFVTKSLKLASTVNSAVEHSPGVSSGPIPVTLGRTALPGVDSMACPAIAVEIAPVLRSDRTVAAEIDDADYQAQIVEALADALMEWKTEWPEVRAEGRASERLEKHDGGGRQP